MTVSWKETFQVLTFQPDSSGSALPTCRTTRLQVQTLASTYASKLLPSLNHVISVWATLQLSVAPAPTSACTSPHGRYSPENISVGSEDREQQAVRDNQISRTG